MSHLEKFDGTLVHCGTPVEKHCTKGLVIKSVKMVYVLGSVSQLVCCDAQMCCKTCVPPNLKMLKKVCKKSHIFIVLVSLTLKCVAHLFFKVSVPQDQKVENH